VIKTSINRRARISVDNLYPLFFKPVYKDYLWGGNRILTQFERQEPPGVYAESWEVSDRTDGMSIVTNGSYKGKPLQELIKTDPESLLGKNSHQSSFPLLLKLIDAHDNLSIQVHPDDKSAKKYGGEAKTEAWIVLDATEDAVIYAGFNQEYPKDEIDRKLPTCNILSMMNTIPVEKGDVISIPGGRMHAIGKGCLILEIQQNSNTTYRVYDWDRLDSAGIGRPLHLSKAREVIHYADTESPRLTPTLLQETPTYKRWNLLSTSHFEIEKWTINASLKWEMMNDQFDLLFFRRGKGQIKWEGGSHPIEKGSSCLIPARSQELTFQIEEDLELFRFFLPKTTKSES